MKSVLNWAGGGGGGVNNSSYYNKNVLNNYVNFIAFVISQLQLFEDM